MPTPERAVIESMFQVVDKEGNDVPFKLNAAQAHIDDNFHTRLIIPKARQEGVSTYFLARQTVRCLGRKNTKAVVISHDSESTERMLKKVKYFIEHLKGPPAKTGTNSANEISFPKTNSQFFIGTAGSRAFGRGDTITDLHCSELAYWPDAKKILSGLLAAVPKRTGCVSIESTGNGAGDEYHSRCLKAVNGQSTYRMIFLPWWSFPEYTIEVTPDEAAAVMANLREDIDEHKLVQAYNLDAGRLLWRRMILEDECDGDLYLWNKDYPSCFDDCFQIAGGGVFQDVNYVYTPDWVQAGTNFHMLKGHPHPKLHYIIGADVAAGVRRDNSVAQIWCLETEEQVGEWVSNKIEPDAFADVLADLGRQYNEAYIGVESNNHGLVTLKMLSSYDHKRSGIRYPLSKIHRTPGKARPTKGDDVARLAHLGVRTTAASKPYIIGLTRKGLKNRAIIHSPALKNELSTFIENENGTMGAAENCFDDRVMATGMVYFVMNRAGLVLAEDPVTNDELLALQNKRDPFSLESIIDEMTKGRDTAVKAPFFPSYLLPDGGLH